MLRFLEVDNVNPVSLHKDEFFHLGIPTAGKVTEMSTGLK
jgi:hypothetical protein